jgi:hypothetical protein
MNKFLSAFLICLVLAVGVMSTRPAGAWDLFKDACHSTANQSSPVCKESAISPNSNPVVDKISIAANLIAAVTAVLAVIFIIISGIKFIGGGGIAGGQRSGDPNAVKGARATLSAAIIGLIIVALSWTITRLIIEQLVR